MFPSSVPSQRSKPTFQANVPSPFQARDAVSHGATSLRKQISKLPCKRPSPRQDGAHEMCHLPNISKAASSVPCSKPGTQCHTSATSLRKQISKLPCKRPHIRGSAQGRALPPMRQGRRIGREPRSHFRSLHG